MAEGLKKVKILVLGDPGEGGRRWVGDERIGGIVRERGGELLELLSQRCVPSTLSLSPVAC